MRPGCEAPVRAVDAGRLVREDARRLERDAAACAAGVDKDGESGAFHRIGFTGVDDGVCASALPVDLREDERGVVGAQDVGTVLARRLAGEALEQGVAREVEAEAGALAAQGEEDAGVGVVHIDIGPPAGDLGQTVAQGVFYPQRGEVRVAQLVGHAA